VKQPEPARLNPLARLGRGIENGLLLLSLTGLIGLAAAQVVMRGVFDQGLAWADEALRLLVLWSAMLGAVAASRDDAHLRIDLLSRFLPPGGRALTAAVVDLFACAVAAVLAWYSWLFVQESREFGDVVLGDQPAWVFQSILPVAFAVIAWRYFAGIVRRLRPGQAGAAAS
jgi:TRAP-type C4-dicarboxylate transport system permease small subunit